MLLEIKLTKKESYNMFCKYCGEQISDDSVFCSKCGKKLTESMTEKKSDPNSINPQKEEKIVIEATIKPTNNDSSKTKSEGIKWISTDNLQWQRPKKARIVQICISVLLGLLSFFFLVYSVEKEEWVGLIVVYIPIIIAWGFAYRWEKYTRYPNAYDIIPKDVADQIEEYEWNGFCKTKYIFFKKDEKYGVIDTRNYCVKIEAIFDSISWRVPNKTIDVTIKNQKNTINILSYRNRNNLDTTISNSYIDSSLQTLMEHFDYVNSVSYSPDGKKIISGSDDNTIKIWDANTRQCLNTLEGHTFSVYSVAYSPDGKNIVSGSYDKTIKIWDANTGVCLKILKGHTSSVSSVAYSPDGTKIISGSDDKTIKIWDVNTGQCIKTLTGHSDLVRSVAFSHDGTKIISGSGDETIKIWDANTGQCINTLTGHSDLVRSVAFSHDGTKIISGSRDHTIKIWDVNTGQCLKTLEGHSNGVYSVAYSPNGTKIISGSYDNTVKIWDANTGQCLKTLEGHSKEVLSVAYSPDGTKIISGSGDKTIKIWGIE